MAGVTDLDSLLASMEPELVSATFVFATLPAGREVPLGLSPVMAFREREGLTLVLPEDEARTAGLDGHFPCALMTLSVYSALEAVGFLAAVTAALAEAGISVNAVSAFYHDHLFVPAERATEALRVLRQMAARAQRSLAQADTARAADAAARDGHHEKDGERRGDVSGDGRDDESRGVTRP